MDQILRPFYPSRREISPPGDRRSEMKGFGKLHAILIGAGSAIDLAGTAGYLVYAAPASSFCDDLHLDRTHSLLNGFERDGVALRGDWSAVGQDISGAVRKIAAEVGPARSPQP